MQSYPDYQRYQKMINDALYQYMEEVAREILDSNRSINRRLDEKHRELSREAELQRIAGPGCIATVEGFAVIVRDTSSIVVREIPLSETGLTALPTPGPVITIRYRRSIQAVVDTMNFTVPANVF